MSIQDDFFQAEVRIGKLLYIPALGADSFADEFEEDFCQNLPERADAPLYAQLPALARFVDGEEWPEAEEVFETIMFTPGFLIHAHTPCRHYRGTGGVFMSGWGNYWTEWLYAPCEADIATVVLAWANERHETDRKDGAA